MAVQVDFAKVLQRPALQVGHDPVWCNELRWASLSGIREAVQSDSDMNPLQVHLVWIQWASNVSITIPFYAIPK